MKNVLFVLSWCLFFSFIPIVNAETSFVDYENNPVLSYSGQSGTFDQMRVYGPQVVEVNGEYWMYYSGIPNGNFVQIGLAKSTDGKNWSRYSSQPVFRCGENTLNSCVNGGIWSSTRVIVISVVYEDGVFKMWYMGNNQNLNAIHRLGYATSEDGINWTAYPDNPVFDGLVSTVVYQSVIHAQDVYRLYFYNSGTGNLYAVDSEDGISWTNDPVVVKNQPLHSIGYLDGIYYAMSEGNIYFSEDGLSFDTTEADLTITNNASGIDFGVVGNKVYAWRTTNYGNIIWSFVNMSIDLSYIDKEEFFTALSPQNKYPLYTQIESPYPSLLETAQWADNEYANGRGLLGTEQCGKYIANCGCAITSLVMAARNAGIEEDVVDGDVNPGNMNSYLEEIGGYTWDGSLHWLAAQTYFGDILSDGRIYSRFASYSGTAPGENPMSFIDAALASGDKAVLGFKGGHFVWLPEKIEEGYFVRDPWRYDTVTANDDVTGEHVADYNNYFDSARAMKITDEPVELSGGNIEAYISGAAGLLYTKVTGEQVGQKSDGVVVDLENAFYGDSEIISLEGATGTKGKHLLVYQSGDEFTLEIVGTGSGEYRVEFFTISEGGKIETYTLEGSTIPGVTSTFSFNLETGEVAEEPLSYEQFLALLNTVLADYPKQQRKFFLQWARMMFDSMQDKSVTQALKKIEVYKKLLKAKKINSPILGGALDLLTEGLKKK